MVPPLPLCENCKRPATLVWTLDDGTDEHTCDRCKPASGVDARPLAPAAPDVSGRVLVSREEAAQMIGVSLDTFDRHVRTQVGARMIGDRPMFSVERLQAWAASAPKSLS